MSYSRQSILFISGLDKSVNENMLYQLFNDYSISYIKIAKDHQTRESFGYAFVGFKNHSKAEEAISKLNYSKLAKKTLRICWYNREPNNYRNHPEYNIFVKKINKGVTHKEFHDYFSQFGTIVSAKLAEDEEGEMMGYGFVLYDSAEGAKKAIDECNEKEWKGKKLYVGQFEKNRPKKPIRYNNIYVRNIPKKWTDDDIRKYFEKYGKISSMIIREPSAEKLNPNLPAEKKEQILSHKYAFVCFESLDGPATKAVNEVPYYKITDTEYNKKIDSLVEILRKQKLDEDKLHKCACYLDENDLSEKIQNDEALLKSSISEFNKQLLENDGIYIIKDKTDRLDCCQALKKVERAKRLRLLYEKIKKKIKEKYKFCNLYVKNLPDDFTEDQLKELFQKYGEIRSKKIVKKELLSRYLGLKKSVKVFGFVCFFEQETAQKAKVELNQKQIVEGGPKLYVDYHQTKAERTEFLKLKLIKESEKMKYPPQQKFPMRPMPGFAQPQMMRRLPNMPPQQMNYMMQGNPQMMMNENMMLQPQPGQNKTEFYGDRLYAKINSIPMFRQHSNFFPKIIGIFLAIKENQDYVLNRLLTDDNFFQQQVQESINLLLTQSQKNE